MSVAPEPDRSLDMFCPHCAGWFASKTHPKQFSRLEADSTTASGVRERFYCDVPRDVGVELINAAAHGTLTPWEEWRRDVLVQELEYYEHMVSDLTRELRDYYDYRG